MICVLWTLRQEFFTSGSIHVRQSSIFLPSFVMFELCRLWRIILIRAFFCAAVLFTNSAEESPNPESTSVKDHGTWESKLGVIARFARVR